MQFTPLRDFDRLILRFGPLFVPKSYRNHATLVPRINLHRSYSFHSILFITFFEYRSIDHIYKSLHKKEKGNDEKTSGL